MIPVSDSAYLFVVFLQCFLISFPLSIIAFGIFFIIRKIPSRSIQFLIPLSAGIITTLIYTFVVLPDIGSAGFPGFLVGMLTHPLLILPPIIIMQKYLRHLPGPYAVFFSAWISLCFAFLFAWFIQQSFQINWGFGDPLRQIACSVVADLFVASIVSGIVICLDRFLPNSGKINS